MKAITTDDAPAAIGPYSQAISSAGLLFCSGQIALPPAAGGDEGSGGGGDLVGGGDVAAEARQALANLQAVIEAGGSSLDRVLRTTVYLVDMADFPRVNEVYAEVFGHARPARACVAVSALPKGARVEVDAIAKCA